MTKLRAKIANRIHSWYGGDREDAFIVTDQILALIKEALPELAKEAGFSFPITDISLFSKRELERFELSAKAYLEAIRQEARIGYVKLADDQSLPEIPEAPVYSDEPYTVMERQAFRTGAITYKGIVKKTGWRKVILEMKNG